MRKHLGIACAFAACALNAAGQVPGSAARESTPDSSRQVANEDRARLDALQDALTGSFAAAAKGEQPALELHATPIRVEGLSDTTLVELARQDAPFEPFRMYILQPYFRQGALRLRTFELPASPGLKEAFASLWGAPESFALLDGAGLTPSLDMPVRNGRVFTAETEHPFPVNRHGAIEMTAKLGFQPGVIEMSDSGFDAAGNKVWGTSEPIRFVRKREGAQVRREGDGLTWIIMKPPPTDAPRLRPAGEGGGEISIHFTFWTSTGLKISTSREPGRGAATIRIPGGAPRPALETALAGIAKGERRKIIVPAALAYGASGRGTVPPNATLIYDIECLDVNNSGQSAPPPSPHSVPTPRGPSPHGAPAPATAPPRGDEPIGSPPTNGTPETPR